MSDTPRTDKVVVDWHKNSDLLDDRVSASFARELERELAAVTKERDELKNERDALRIALRDGIAIMRELWDQQ